MGEKPTALIVSQVYPPDPAAVGQYLQDVAKQVGKAGWRVRVVTSRQSYENPSETYAPREVRGNVEVRRLPFSSFGKASLPRRLAGQLLFCLQAVWQGLCTPSLKVVLVSTSPPFAGGVGIILRVLRGARLVSWQMDINPEQAIRMGQVAPRHPLAWLFAGLNRLLFWTASRVVTLDRYMKQTLVERYGCESDCVEVLPTWPLQETATPIPHADNPFRKKHALEDKFVFMYSGNHSLAHPIAPFLEAARLLQKEDRIVFLFIGGGHRKLEVENFIKFENPANVISLPYQPLEETQESLSAADVHLVSMGANMVGVVHPCKVYGALILGRPVFCLAPAQSHLGDLVKDFQCGWMAETNSTPEALAAAFRRIALLPLPESRAKNKAARRCVQENFCKEKLCGRFESIMLED